VRPKLKRHTLHITVTHTRLFLSHDVHRGWYYNHVQLTQ
jgi:hypothetical protein